jgi:glutamate dehydrogenase
LLSAMTDDVARLVLADNYDQTFAISVAQASGPRDLDAAGRFMRELEKTGRLDRGVEFLPDDEALRVLAREGLGLTRPDLAVLLAYAKIDLFFAIVESDLPDDPYFAAELEAYFPTLAVKRFGGELANHRLKREIVASRLCNKIVNLAGPLFAQRLRELASASGAETARAYVLAASAFGLEDLQARIGALDFKVNAGTQNAMMGEIFELLRRLGLWFLMQLPPGADIAETVRVYGEGVSALKGRFAGMVSPFEAQTTEARITEFQSAGAPQDVAEDVAVLPLLGAAPEIVLLSLQHKVPVDAAAGAYFAIGALVGLDRLRGLAARISAADHWDRLAVRRIVDDLFASQRLLAAEAIADRRDALKNADRVKGAEAANAWAGAHANDLQRTQNFLAELEQGGALTIAKFTLASSQVQKLALASA